NGVSVSFLAQTENVGQHLRASEGICKTIITKIKHIHWGEISLSTIALRKFGSMFISGEKKNYATHTPISEIRPALGIGAASFFAFFYKKDTADSLTPIFIGVTPKSSITLQ
ncbi:MAG: hypothetical protein JKX84_06955, partial [Flavobacteriales bacterium]|nr:hypothetical protein [Flavobacteriales bacterium]